MRTVVDLRNDDERGADAGPRPSSITTVHVPLDASEDREFWDVWASGPQFGTPLYYRPHLERFPARSIAVLRAIARAHPSGEEDQGPLLQSFLAQRGTTAEALIVALLAELDVEAHLRADGLSGGDIAALRARLLGS